MQPTLRQPVEPGRKLNRKQLINRLNALNFSGGTILISLRHKRFGNILTLPARPKPCADETLHCEWVKPQTVPTRLSDYTCCNFLLNDGKLSFAVTPQTLTLNEQGVSFSLPAISRQTANRHIRRHAGHQVNAQFIQSGCLFDGQLIDFSSESMRIDLVIGDNQSAHWLNPEQPAELILLSDGDVLYTGSCQIVRDISRGPHLHTLVVVPNNPAVSRFRNSDFRSRRQHLVPAPNASFQHPLTGRLTNLLTCNISGTGFAVDEEAAESLLLPGLVIPDLQLHFTRNFSIKCRAQVVYRNPLSNGNTGKVRYGVTFLDMPADDHLQLLSLVHRAENEQAHLSQSIDIDRLLDFFFNAGFMYPEKYASIAADKNSLKETYRRLYNDCPAIARHFVYQDNDNIYAHMAAVRFYQKAWLVHHHAANGEHSTMAGLHVLNQMTRWLNDSRYIPSVHLDYFFCYFRDTNRFPMRVFGGIHDGINDPTTCSLDAFAYYHHEPDKDADWDLGQPWSLQRASEEDIQELGFFYEAHSGGLLTNAFDLLPESLADTTLNDEYSAHGFARERHIFSLKDETSLKAVFVVNIADSGLNLSELTSAIQVFVPDHEDLPRELLDLILSLLCLKFKRPQVPVLMFPAEAAEYYEIEIEKIYMLWVFNAARMDMFFRELKKIIRTISH